MSNKKSEKQKARKDAVHYVNNDEFYQAMVLHIKAIRQKLYELELIENTEVPYTKYKEALTYCRDRKILLVPITDYIGECIMKISHKLANRGHFANYPFREDMIADGIDNCLMYINNFNPEKSKNPFAYYSQICWYAFIRRIEKEKTELYTKYSVATEKLLHDVHEEDRIYINGKYGSDHSDELMHEFMEKFEESKRKKKREKERKKKEKKRTNLELLVDEGDDTDG